MVGVCRNHNRLHMFKTYEGFCACRNHERLPFVGIMKSCMCTGTSMIGYMSSGITTGCVNAGIETDHMSAGPMIGCMIAGTMIGCVSAGTM